MFRIIAMQPTNENVTLGKEVLAQAQEEIWPLLKQINHPWTSVFRSMEEWLLMPSLYYMEEENYLVIGHRVKYYVNPETLALRFALFGPHFRHNFTKSEDRVDTQLMGDYLTFLDAQDFNIKNIDKLILNGLIVGHSDFAEYLFMIYGYDRERINLVRRSIESVFGKSIENLIRHSPALEEYMTFKGDLFSSMTVENLAAYNAQHPGKEVSLWDLMRGEGFSQKNLKDRLMIWSVTDTANLPSILQMRFREFLKSLSAEVVVSPNAARLSANSADDAFLDIRAMEALRLEAKKALWPVDYWTDFKIRAE